MRTLEQIDRELASTREALRALEYEREGAEEDARDTRKGMVRRRYELIGKVLKQLDLLGESVGDAEGCALHIKGKTFEIHPESGVREV